MNAPARRIVRVAGGVGAVATTAAATAWTLLARRRKSETDRHAGEDFGALPADVACTVAADDGVGLHVEQVEPAAGGEPSVTLIGVHDIGLDAASWHFQRRAVSALRLPRVRQVYYDQRGHGASCPVTDDTADIEQLAADLHAVLRAMAPEGRLVLAGHGLGGMVIMALAERAPALFADRVRGVALLATSAGDIAAGGALRGVLSKYSPVGWGVGGIGELADWQPVIAELVRTAGGRITRSAVRRVLFGDHASPSVVDFVLDTLASGRIADLAKFTDSVAAHERYRALALLKDAEVQVIGGDADMLLPVEHGERIAEELPQARVVRLQGVGHLPQLEQPDVVTSQLIDLLQEVGDAEHGARQRDEVFRRMVRRWFSTP